MTLPSTSTQPPAALRGWRARAWSGVLFVALLKGLIPHAALASVLMQGNPALVWCASGLPGTTAADAKAASEIAVSAHDCVCATPSDGALPVRASETLEARRTPVLLPSQSLQFSQAHRALPPPACGPPRA